MSLIAIRKSIHMWVVEKTFVAITPGETLAANAKMGVRDKLWLLMAVVLLLQECVQHANSNTWKGNHEGEDLPGLTWG